MTPNLSPVDTPIQALIFDLDGVITDTAEYHYLAWQRLADELAIPFGRKENERLRGIGRMESLDIILERQTQPITEANKQELAARKNGYYKELIATITPKDMLPNMLDLLLQARERSIPVGLASASANAPVILEKLEVGSLFNYVVDPTLLARGKPDPEIFLEAARGLGVLPSACVGVEDAHAGIEAIKSAGMFAVGVGDHLEDASCDWLVSSTSELSLGEICRRFELKGA